MTGTIEMTPADLAIVRDRLAAHLPAGVQVWVFGSRATGMARRYSDLDLALEGISALDLGLLSQLADALSESNLTIKVDLVDLHCVDPAFRQAIAGQLIEFRFRDFAT